MPVFSDIPAFQATAAAAPGVSAVQPQADGTVRAVVNGRPVTLRPDFTVTRSPAGSKRAIVTGGGAFTFDTGDGRRQRFSIVP